MGPVARERMTFKDDIAELVRSLPRAFPIGTGDCLDRSLTGAAVLTALGLPTTLKLGALLYRVGPDPVRDCITICAPDRHSVEAIRRRRCPRSAGLGITDPVGAKQKPPVLGAPNGVIADLRAYWTVDKPQYDPEGIKVPTLVIHAEWDADLPSY